MLQFLNFLSLTKWIKPTSIFLLSLLLIFLTVKSCNKFIEIYLEEKNLKKTAKLETKLKKKTSKLWYEMNKKRIEEIERDLKEAQTVEEKKKHSKRLLKALEALQLTKDKPL